MTGQGFHFLAQMIGGYLHQDMDLEADSVPEAIAIFAGEAGASTRAGVVSDMQRFLETYDNRLAEEFASRFGRDFTPDEIGQSVSAFFDMVAVLLDDSAAYTKYLD